MRITASMKNLLLALCLALILLLALGTAAQAATANIIDTLNIQIQAPENGGAPPTTATADNALVTAVQWYDGETGAPLAPGSGFVSGKTYKAVISLAANGSDAFAMPSEMDVSVNGKTADRVNPTPVASALTVEHSFTVGLPKFTETVVDNTTEWFTGYVVSIDETLPLGQPGDITFGEANKAGDAMTRGEFISGSLPDGMSYSYSMDGYRIYGTPTKAGTYVSGWRSTYKIASGLVFDVTITVLPADEITEVHITGIDAPVIGKPLDWTARAGDDSYTVANVSWEPSANVFEENKTYTVMVAVEAVGSANFSAAPTAYINGERAAVISGAGSEELKISYTFPTLKAGAPVITKQPVSVEANPGESATFTVSATGDDLHYQWYGVDAGVPWKVGIDSPTLTIPDASIVDSAYFSYWCVITNEAGQVTSEKATLTLAKTAYVMPFTDVTQSAWYYASVRDANKMGLINGKTATQYKPADNMTFAEAVKLAACMHQLYTEGTVTLGNGSSKWYSSYYDYCRDNGIIPATDTAFEPGYNALLADAGKLITRAQYALLFSRALPDTALPVKNTIPDNSLPDVSVTQSVYDQAIYKLYRAGIVNGADAKGSFNPDSNIQRSEVAAILIRMMDDTSRVGAPSELGK